MADVRRRSPRRGGTSVPTRRKRVWFFSEDVNTHGGSDNEAFDILSGARTVLGVGGFPGWTVATIIGQAYAQLNTLTALDTLDLRLGIVPGTQGQSNPNLPMPYTDEGDFLWTNTIFRTLITTNQMVYSQTRLDLNVRAQRKLAEVEDTLWFVSAQNAVDACTVTWRLRILMLAP